MEYGIVELMLLCYHSLNFVVTCFIFKKQKSIRHHNLFLQLQHLPLFIEVFFCHATWFHVNIFIFKLIVNGVITKRFYSEWISNQKNSGNFFYFEGNIFLFALKMRSLYLLVMIFIVTIREGINLLKLHVLVMLLKLVNIKQELK